MKRLIGGFLLVLMSGVAIAGSWSITGTIGSAIPADAHSGAQGEIAATGAACGCAVSGSADVRQLFAGVGLAYRVNRWVSVSGGGWAARSFQENVVLSGSSGSAPASIRDRLSGGYVLAEAHHRFARRWAWAAGVGLAVTSDSESGSITVNGSTTTFPADATTRVSPAFSAAVSYLFNRRWSAGLSYLEIPNVGSSGNQYTAGAVGLAAATASYRF